MANLKVEIRESISLDDNNYNSYNFHTISGINDISRRRVTVPTTEQELIAMSTSVGAGTYVEENVRYIRITNLSKEFPIMLCLKNDDTDEVKIKVDKRASFIYTGEADVIGGLSGSGVQNSFDADNTVIGTTDNLGDLVNITAYTSASSQAILSGSVGSGSGIVKANVELFIASL